MSHNVLIFFNRMVLYHILTDKQGYHKNKLGDCGLYFNSKEVSTVLLWYHQRGIPSSQQPQILANFDKPH